MLHFSSAFQKNNLFLKFLARNSKNTRAMEKADLQWSIARLLF